MYNPLRLAVLIPCYNEEVAIGTVVRDFQRVLPQATIYGFDNNSRDRTVDIARSHGGNVTLSDSPMGGLRATIRIPA